MGNLRTDQALYGETEARRRHLSRAAKSGELWQHPEATNSLRKPLPESCLELSQAPPQRGSRLETRCPDFVPAAPAPQRQPPSEGLGEAEHPQRQPRSVSNMDGPPAPKPPQSQPPSVSNRGDPPAPVADLPTASARASERPAPLHYDQPAQFSDRSRLPPQLPQLWAEQPRYMTPHTPGSASTGRSVALSSVRSGAHVQIDDRLGGTPLRPPLRRMDSDPGIQRGYINPALRLGPSLLKDPEVAQGRSASDRYSTTFDFG